MSERIAVMGAGVMGSGIAQVMAIAGHEVICRDVSEEVLSAARTGVATGRFGVRGAVERGKLTNEQAEAALNRLTFTTDLDAAVEVDIIIEAIPEDLALKTRFWRELDSMAPGRTIFASNSSGFSIAALGAASDRPDRMVGMTDCFRWPSGPFGMVSGATSGWSQ